jgi:hypothetical protein
LILITASARWVIRFGNTNFSIQGVGRRYSHGQSGHVEHLGRDSTITSRFGGDAKTAGGALFANLDVAVGERKDRTKYSSDKIGVVLPPSRQ